MSRSVIGERVMDAAHIRQRRSDGWTQAACTVCLRSILVRGSVGDDPLNAPCCSIECAREVDRTYASSDETRDCLGLAVHGCTPDNEDSQPRDGK